MQVTKTHAAIITTTVLAAATGGTVFAAMATTSKAALFAYGILGVALSGASIGAITAAFDASTTTAREYMKSIPSHAGIAIGVMSQFVAQTLFQAAVQGFAQGITAYFRRLIGGPDFTFAQQ